jgi:hypothetical protein
MLSLLTLTERVRKLVVFTKDKKLVAGNFAMVKAALMLLRQSLDKRPALTSKDVAGGAVV